MNTITDFLDLEDSNVIITELKTVGKTKEILVETPAKIHFCPICNCKMYSRGIKTRHINHPILRDGYQVIIVLKQRRWRCTNSACNYEANESFKFVDKNKRNSNATDFLIINELKDLSNTVSGVAEKFFMSDTAVIETFYKYVKMERLPLSEIISVDEVHLELDEHCKYALVIQDFFTGDPIDLVKSRRSDITLPYFTSIPKEERYAVKYLISDMYNPYLNYVNQYFLNAVAVVDSFHVIQHLNRYIDSYIKQLTKRYRKRDRDNYLKKHPDCDDFSVIPMSEEVYILKKYKWLVLKNQDSIEYYSDFHIDKRLNALMNTYDYEYRLFRIDPKLKDFRDLKEKYIRFNSRNAGNPMQARLELDELIHIYLKSEHEIFNKFANTLIRNYEYILNSFVMVEKYGPGKIYDSRLSNGPIESLNRKIKDLRRLGRGYRNFDHFRTRFLFSTRKNNTINGKEKQ